MNNFKTILVKCCLSNHLDVIHGDALFLFECLGRDQIELLNNARRDHARCALHHRQRDAALRGVQVAVIEVLIHIVFELFFGALCLSNCLPNYVYIYIYLFTTMYVM